VASVGILLELLLKEHYGIFPDFEVLLRVYLYTDIALKYLCDAKNGDLALCELILTCVGWDIIGKSFTNEATMAALLLSLAIRQL
jgi:hypothetical protein